LTVSEILGVWKSVDEQEKTVAIKLFKGSVTSDGSSADEMIAYITAGSRPGMIDPIAKIHGHPETKVVIVRRRAKGAKLSSCSYLD
jgi:hypothetical protein